ncbi:MAG: acyl-CoA dehydrogenase [Pseudomonadota bacterium]|nr:acyl-CoA dehydrogenase [Pseudomonadota bacterium]
MAALLVLLVIVAGGWALAYFSVPLLRWTLAGGLLLLVVSLAAPAWWLYPLWLIWGLVALANFPLIRQHLYMAPMLRVFRGRLPSVSATEREALEAGGVWWDAELFSGHPHWQRFLEFPKARLTEVEQAFLDGPAEELCRMLDDWRITFDLKDLPPNVWAFIRRNRFFGMIIPTEYGGLGFSAEAHSQVVAKVASRSGSAAVTVMVPNSLGPAELLLHYGTDAQKSHYLPRLADGREIPCFALTNPYAGSDASSIPDKAVVCQGEYQGQQVLGMRVTWEKRYITLAPVATVLGLAFQLYDPERLLGGEDYLGITLALIPTGHPGVRIGRRHYPLKQAFQNGPTSGTEVFIPMDMVIGGRAQIGQGWRMLMERLAVGRSISLPALAAAAIKFCARNAGAYARVRKQFKLPIGRFEGIEEVLARIAGDAYAVEAARRLTTAALDQGFEPAVISALLKYQTTERQRQAINDAMDIHGGRAICEGPSNYLANAYQGVPVSITVEGANILTRSLIVFGQGAIRCHPWVFKELEAALDTDPARSLAAFDTAISGHVGYLLNNLAQGAFHHLTLGRFMTVPRTGPVARYYAGISCASLAFALMADGALLVLGGQLKRRERLSGRFADVLSEMYFASAVLKRYEDDGCPAEDLPLVDYACQRSLHVIEERLADILDHFPSRPLGWVLKRIVQPFGMRHHGPDDPLGQAVAALLLAPSPARERLTAGIYVNRDPADVTGRLEHAFDLIIQADAIEARIQSAARAGQLGTASGREMWLAAERAQVIGDGEVATLEAADKAVRAAIDVDDFAPEELTGHAAVEVPMASTA